ncbi:hypothetical protein T439DRAFT_356292 [Meredithblackwellia eburnea MCA 4105]
MNGSAARPPVCYNFPPPQSMIGAMKNAAKQHIATRAYHQLDKFMARAGALQRPPPNFGSNARYDVGRYPHGPPLHPSQYPYQRRPFAQNGYNQPYRHVGVHRLGKQRQFEGEMTLRQARRNGILGPV